MSPNHAGPFKKWTTNMLPSLLLLAVFMCILAVNRAASPNRALARENKAADSKQKTSDAKEPPGEKTKTGKAVRMLRPDHNHPAFSERVEERARLVTRYIDRAGVHDPNVLRAMRTVPRHAFVRPGDLRRAYADHPLPIGLNQTISQPYIVAYMTEMLKLDPNSKVFEVGTGSGYQAAVCAEIACEVYTVEIIEKLAKSAQERLKKLGYHNVAVKAADGYFGWAQKGPFDAIIITAATDLVPPPLRQQLKPGGRMILPLGSPYGVQTLVLVTKDRKGKLYSRELLPVRFVPMTGRVLKSEEPPKK